MATQSNSASFAALSPPPIRSLNDNDVLVGRGSGPNKYIGNRRFRQHVANKRVEYLVCDCAEQKATIAQAVVNHIHSLGGRFVRQEKKGRRVGDLLVDGVWREEPDFVAIEKCKQSLREKPSGRERHDDVSSEATLQSSNLPVLNEIAKERTVLASSSAATEAEMSAAIPTSRNAVPTPPEPISRLVVPPFADNTCTASPQHACSTAMLPTVDQRLLLYRQVLALQSPQTPILPPVPSVNGHMADLNGWRRPLPIAYQDGILHQPALLSNLANSVTQSWMIGTSRRQRPRRDEVPPAFMESRKHGREDVARANSIADIDASSVNAIDQGDCETLNSLTAATTDEDEVAAAFLLSSLGAGTDRPVVSEEQIEKEKAAMTSDEKSAMLDDLFGKMQLDEREKRAKRDLDRESIAYLVGRMRVEIDRIPSHKKTAMMGALKKCRADEFSDARLEKFLRCEGMNVELAAERFAKYWEKRKQVFGPEKYMLRMALSEALQDDLVALEAGYFGLLPHKDFSQRPLVFCFPNRHTRKGYSSESMLRAVWYIAEVSVEDSGESCGGHIGISFDRDATIWNYDQKLFDTMAVMLQDHLPVRTLALHVLCPPKALARFAFPVIRAIMGKELRARMKIHDVPESEICQSLAEYGITRDMLPIEMGGTVQLNQSEWLANRRAAEMEEI